MPTAYFTLPYRIPTDATPSQQGIGSAVQSNFTSLLTAINTTYGAIVSGATTVQGTAPVDVTMSNGTATVVIDGLTNTQLTFGDGSGNLAQSADMTFASHTLTAANLTSGGTVIFSGLPTSDPGVLGQLWSNSGVLTVSAGP